MSCSTKSVLPGKPVKSWRQFSTKRCNSSLFSLPKLSLISTLAALSSVSIVGRLITSFHTEDYIEIIKCLCHPQYVKQSLDSGIFKPVLPQQLHTALLIFDSMVLLQHIGALSVYYYLWALGGVLHNLLQAFLAFPAFHNIFYFAWDFSSSLPPN